MIDPRYWVPHWRARRALAGYPIYTVPHARSEAMLDAALAMENFGHFMAVRLERLAAFRAWLERHFGVAATLDEPGLCAVNAWGEKYGGGLVDDFVATIKAFAHYQPAWEGAFAGCNVMVDLAIFKGEYLISRRPRLRWICDLDCPDGYVPQDIPDFGRPHIGGFARHWSVNVFQTGEALLLAARKRSEIGHDPMSAQKDVMLEGDTQDLKMADAPNDGTPFIF